MTPEVRTALSTATGTASSSFERISRTITLSAAVLVPALAIAPLAMAQIPTPTVTNTITVAPAIADPNNPLVKIPGTVFGASLSPDAQSIWVAGYNGTTNPGFVSLVDIASQTVGKSAAVGIGPADIAFSSGGTAAYVTNLYGSTVSVVSVPHLTINQTIDLSTVPADFPYGIAYEGGHLLVTSLGQYNTVPEFTNIPPVVLNKTLPVEGQSGRPTVITSATANFGHDILIPVYSTENGVSFPRLKVINPTTAKIVASMSMRSSAAFPQAVVASPDGKYAYVSLYDSNGYGQGGVWVIDLVHQRTVTVIKTGDDANFGEAISADGKYVLITGYLFDQVALIDTATNAVDYIIQTGNQPNAIALSQDNSEAFVTNQNDGTVTVVSFAPSL